MHTRIVLYSRVSLISAGLCAAGMTTLAEFLFGLIVWTPALVLGLILTLLGLAIYARAFLAIQRSELSEPEEEVLWKISCRRYLPALGVASLGVLGMLGAAVLLGFGLIDAGGSVSIAEPYRWLACFAVVWFFFIALFAWPDFVTLATSIPARRKMQQSVSQDVG